MRTRSSIPITIASHSLRGFNRIARGLSMMRPHGFGIYDAAYILSMAAMKARKVSLSACST